MFIFNRLQQKLGQLQHRDGAVTTPQVGSYNTASGQLQHRKWAATTPQVGSYITVYLYPSFSTCFKVFSLRLKGTFKPLFSHSLAIKVTKYPTIDSFIFPSCDNSLT